MAIPSTVQITNPPNGFVNLKGTIMGRSNKATQMEITSINGSDLKEKKTEWFPLSQTRNIYTEVEIGNDLLVVSKWICEQKSLRT